MLIIYRFSDLVFFWLQWSRVHSWIKGCRGNELLAMGSAGKLLL